jgi:hypothetical protein
MICPPLPASDRGLVDITGSHPTAPQQATFNELSSTQRVSALRMGGSAASVLVDMLQRMKSTPAEQLVRGQSPSVLVRSMLRYMHWRSLQCSIQYLGYFGGVVHVVSTVATYRLQGSAPATLCAVSSNSMRIRKRCRFCSRLDWMPCVCQKGSIDSAERTIKVVSDTSVATLSGR